MLYFRCQTSMDTPENIFTPDEMRNREYRTRLGVSQDADSRAIEAAFKREQGRYHKLITEGKTEYRESYYLLEEAYIALINQLPEEPSVAPQPSVSESRHHPTPSPPPPRKPTTPLALVVQVLIFIVCNVLVFGYMYVRPPGSSPIIPGVVCGAVGIFAAIRFSRKGREDYAGRTLILTIALCVNVVITYSKFQQQLLYVDNQNAFEVVIKVNGEPIDTLYNFEWRKNFIRPGNYTFAAYKIPDDSLVEAFDAVISLDSRTMYNVLSSGEYLAGTEGYTDNPIYMYYSGMSSPSYPESSIKLRWFDLNYDYIFESAPYEITSFKTAFSSDHETQERTYIVRK